MNYQSKESCRNIEDVTDGADSQPRCAVASGSPVCVRCKNEPHQCLCDLAASWEESGCCGMCDGSGVIDGYEDDPNWYQPGETKPCPQCGGTGQ